MLWKRLNRNIKVNRVGNRIAKTVFFIYPPKAAEGLVWVSPASIRRYFICPGTAERVPDFRRRFAPGSFSYVYRDSAETPGRFGDWFSPGIPGTKYLTYFQ